MQCIRVHGRSYGPGGGGHMVAPDWLAHQARSTGACAAGGAGRQVSGQACVAGAPSRGGTWLASANHPRPLSGHMARPEWPRPLLGGQGHMAGPDRSGCCLPCFMFEARMFRVPEKVPRTPLFLDFWVLPINRPLHPSISGFWSLLLGTYMAEGLLHLVHHNSTDPWYFWRSRD